jgi:hypothetical protein
MGAEAVASRATWPSLEAPNVQACLHRVEGRLPEMSGLRAPSLALS